MEKITRLRIYAFIIDSILISLITSVLSGFFKLKTPITKFHFAGLNWITSFQLYLIIVIAYFVFFDVFKNGTTIGKQITHLKVVSKLENRDLSKLENAKRSVVKSFVTTIPLLTIIFYFFKGVAVQDYVSKTKTILSKIKLYEK